MNSNQPQQNFFDARTIAAFVLMAITFIGWRFYMEKKYPEAYKKAEVSAPAAKSDDVPAAPPVATSTTSSVPAQAAPAAETLTHVQTDYLEFDFSSKGMGLKNIKIPKYKDRSGQIVTMGHPTAQNSPFETRLSGRAEPLDFAIEKVNDLTYVGRAKLGDLQVVKRVEITPDKYLLVFKVQTSGTHPQFVGITTALTEEINDPKKTNLLLPQLENQEFYVETADSHTRDAFKSEDFNKTWSKVKVASIGSQYFTEALVDKSSVMPEGKAILNHAAQSAQIVLDYPVLNPGADYALEYHAFIGPKSFGLLSSIDATLAHVVDFGFFNWIARHIFGLLHYFYSLVGNWGLAIICLTVVVRLCVLPFNIYSYKSMKKMQVIQPQMAALKERYKDDQQRQQQEIMKLMRESGANPLGGCLPILLQFPIFLALYQVLGHSIELYQAPFGLWIHDLSLKDPYYILPVLMGITMFFQQKTTPAAGMDPAQQKVLMFMPLVFTAFMVTLPSGLTLYMLVGAVFSVAQQLYFMRTTNTPAKAAA